MIRHASQSLGTLLTLAACATVAHASVAWKPIYGGRGTAMGGATAASGADTTATLINPALLVQVKGVSADVGSLVFYHPGDITYRREPDALSPAGYKRVETDNSTSLVPYAGAIYHPEEQRWAVGLGVNVPFAEDLEWPNGPNRYFATKSSFSFIFVTPAVAVQVHDKLALGAGLDYVMFDGQIQTKLDFGSIAGQPENPAFDGDANLEGDGTGWGYNVGLLWSPHEKFDVGLSYLSGVAINADGIRDAGVPPQLQAALGLPAKISFTRERLELRLPEVWRVGAALKPTKSVTLVAEIQKLDRSNEKFLLKNYGSTRPDVLPDDEENLIAVPFQTAYSYKIGGEYVRDAWAFRLGGLVDQNGVPDESMSPAGVDTRKLELSGGVGYQWSKVRLDLAYSRVIGADRHVTASQTFNRLSGVPANGYYELNTNILAFGLHFRFK